MLLSSLTLMHHAMYAMHVGCLKADLPHSTPWLGNSPLGRSTLNKLE